MDDESSRKCIECDGEMSPIVVMDRNYRHVETLAYRLPDDRVSFWSGKYATAGTVQAFMCASCGRIALYAGAPDA
jgi:hypothetical protein